jgi:hypothetical protein
MLHRYVSDVFISPEHRKAGFGSFLTATITSHEPFQRFRRLLLMTVDAAPLYQKHGWSRCCLVQPRAERFFFFFFVDC